MNENLYNDLLANALRISEFDKYVGETNFSNVAVKFVVHGSETYLINGKKFVLNEGEYLVGNNNQLSEVIIEKKTKGLCIDVSNNIITEIIDNKFDNVDLKEFIISDRFLINKYHSENTTLGHSLCELAKALSKKDNSPLFTTELFYSIGENIVNDQSIIFSQISKLNYKKQEVTDDVFRNLLNAKDYIEANYLTALNLDDILGIALMSKYAFIRLFKTTFGYTPYQLILQKRLLFARESILSGKTIAQVALLAGFADSPSFSKAYKKHFGTSPSKLLK